MGGAGSGNWYRFDKKTTTGKCHSIDVRYLYREGLLKPGRWFFLRWSRAGRETGSIRVPRKRNARSSQTSSSPRLGTSGVRVSLAARVDLLLRYVYLHRRSHLADLC